MASGGGFLVTLFQHVSNQTCNSVESFHKLELDAVLNLPLRLGLVLTLSLLAVSGSIASEPSLESVSPLMVQRGGSCQVELVGAGLENCREVLFYSDGIRCTRVEAVDAYRAIATLAVDADCRIASHPFRVRSDDGFSELRTLRVSRFAVTKESVRERVDAVIPIPSQPITICGVLQDGEYDRYSVSLKTGQRFTAEVEAIRLGGDLLDTQLTVTDPTGSLTAINDDGALLHQDPAVSFVAAVDGIYTIEVRETSYGGSATAQYALHVGPFPPGGVAFPAGGQAGKPLSVEVLSVSTHPAGAASTAVNASPGLRQHVILPEAGADFQLFATDQWGSSATAITFRVSPFPNVLEQEPNDELSALTKAVSPAAAPIAFNGIIQDAGDIDYFAFHAEQGEALQVEAYADRVGSPVDTFVSLLDATGVTLAQNDDWGSQDSRIEWTAPAAGTYWLAVRDKLDRGSADGVYRIELTSLKPWLTAFLPRPERTSQDKQTIHVPQGNRGLAKVGVRRSNTQGSHVSLTFTDLPAGVSASPVFVAPDKFWTLAVLEAAPEAQTRGTLSRVVPSTTVDGTTISGEFRQVVDLIAETADRVYESVEVDRLAIAVTPAIPFSIDLLQPQAALAVGGTIELEVRLKRDASFSAPVRVELPFLPDGCIAEPFIVIESGQNAGRFKVSANSQTEVGNFNLAAVAQVSLAESRSRSARPSGSATSASNDENWFALKGREVASRTIELSVAESPLTGEFQPLAAEQSTTVKVHCKLRKSGPVPEQLHCELEGLPNRITATPIDIDSAEALVEFELVVPSDAPLGSFSQIQCRLSGVFHGSEVSFVVPAHSALQVTEPGKLFRGQDGRVLSPLESLREQNGKRNGL